MKAVWSGKESVTFRQTGGQTDGQAKGIPIIPSQLCGGGLMGAPMGFGDLGRMAIYFQGARKHWLLFSGAGEHW